MKSDKVIQDNIDSLKVLDSRSSKIKFATRRYPEKNLVEFSIFLKNTPGLIKTVDGALEICDKWMILLSLGPNFPVTSPEVYLAPLRSGRPWHPNILPVHPFRLCYGRHLPCLLLDKLVFQIGRMLILDPKLIMTDENKSLNHEACRDVRLLIREGYAPLSGKGLPCWCSRNNDNDVVVELK